MTRLERTTTSPSPRSSAECSPRASRASAAALSPCEPVATARMARFGSSRARSGGQTRSAGHSRYGTARVLSRRAGRRLRDARVRRDAPAEGDDLAPVTTRDLAEHLEPVHVRGEHRDDDRLPRAGDDRLERAPHALFAARRPARVDVRRVAEEEVDALARELLEARHVERLAVGRRLVELEVARVHDPPRVGADRERRRVGDRVGDANGLDLEGADLLGLRAASRSADRRARAPRARRRARARG